ncbi:hypothetical protein QTP88_012814 [Uroleucon formosanum]
MDEDYLYHQYKKIPFLSSLQIESIYFLIYRNPIQSVNIFNLYTNLFYELGLKHSRTPQDPNYIWCQAPKTYRTTLITCNTISYTMTSTWRCMPGHDPPCS